MTPNKQRHKILIAIIATLSSILICRVFYLQVIKYDFFKDKGDTQLKGVIGLHPNRGNIYDINLTPLAITQKSYSIFAVKNEMTDMKKTAEKTAAALNENPSELYGLWTRTRANFLWIKRQVSPELAKKLKEMRLLGIGTYQTEKRVYPQDSLASQVMGYVGIDNQGLSGLEYKFDTKLKGSSGKIIVERDPRGFQLMTGQRKTIPNYDGLHIVTTLEAPIQYKVEQALKKGVEASQADSGQVIVMNPNTGDILAMASYPNFNPNIWNEFEKAHRKNKTIGDSYEPGSMFKIITVAGAIEEKLVHANTIFHVPEHLKFYTTVINEAHERPAGEGSSKTVKEIIRDSLNVGTTLIALKLTDKKLYHYTQEFGFGQYTDIDLPGESKGLLRDIKYWSKVDVAMISFGQGIAVTALQMASAIGTIANGGTLMRPRIVSYLTNAELTTKHTIPIEEKRRVISKETAKEVSEIMESVVSDGTGKLAQIPGYRIAGKTGTAQKPRIDGRGYEAGAYIGSFVGFFPASKPEILILVSVDRPRTSIWGSTNACPIFKEIAEFIITYKQIPPDQTILDGTEKE